jgi:CHAT domain-containing protein/Tfp pilus assembly protein PilF
LKIAKTIFICSLLLAFQASAQLTPVWKLYYDSTQVFWAKDWNRTVQLLEKAEHSAVADLGIYHENYLTILNDLGTAYWKAHNYPRAEKTLQKTLALKSEVYAENNKEVLLSISNLAGFYQEKGLWNKARSLYGRILAMNPAHIPADIFLAAAQNLVDLYDLNQQPDSADYLLRRIDQWQLIAAGSYADFQHRLYRARTFRKLNQYSAAQSVLDGLVPAVSKLNEDEFGELYIKSLQEQGSLYLETGMYSQAEKDLLRAYELVTSETNRDYLLTELSNNLAHVYDKLNIFDKALDYYEESLSRCRASYEENSLPCVILLNNIAGIHLKQEKIDQAIKDYVRITAEFARLLPATDPLYVTSLNNLATAYRKDDQLKRARECLVKAEALLRQNGRPPDDLLATVLNNVAVLNTAQGHYEEAARNYREAYAIKRAIYGDDSILLMDLVNNLAVTYWALDKPDDAIPLFKKSMAMALRQVTYVFPNLSENEQVQFYQNLREDFERFNTIAVQWRSVDPGLLSQMFQNRTVIKSLQFFTQQRRRKLIALRHDASLNELFAHLKERRDELGHLYQLPLHDARQGGVEVAALEKEVDALEKTISLRSNEAAYDNGLAAGDITWKMLAERLQPGEAVVEMVRFRKYDRQSTKQKSFFGFADSVYYAAIILTRETKGNPAVVVCKDGNNLETRYFNYYKNALKYNLADDLSYHFFWEPFQKEIAGKTKIYFSSDGVYHKINLNTLRDDKTRKYLLEQYEIVNLLNPVQVLEKKPASTETRHNAVLMGDPVFDVDPNAARERSVNVNHFTSLPGTQQEIVAIDKVLQAHAWRTSVYLEASATEANLKRVHSPSVLHIASHGFFSADVVSLNHEAKKEFLFQSGIVLTGANKSLENGSTAFQNDGVVTAYEVMNLDLSNTQLVVLSACETGLGKIENGEGVFGLQRSFMQAGARNMLISLWKVDDDATRDLMIKFYQYLALGNSLNASLKKAQADQARLLTNPSLWGGFVLVGNN